MGISLTKKGAGLASPGRSSLYHVQCKRSIWGACHHILSVFPDMCCMRERSGVSGCRDLGRHQDPMSARRFLGRVLHSCLQSMKNAYLWGLRTSDLPGFKPETTVDRRAFSFAGYGTPLACPKGPMALYTSVPEYPAPWHHVSRTHEEHLYLTYCGERQRGESITVESGFRISTRRLRARVDFDSIPRGYMSPATETPDYEEFRATETEEQCDVTVRFSGVELLIPERDWQGLCR